MKELTSKNMISNRSSFWDSEAAIWFVTSKRVYEWSQILISSLDWSYMQNKANVKLAIYRLSRKMWLFFVNDSKYRHNIYRWKSFFAMIKNSRSLPQNKASFGSDLLAKFCYFVRKSVLMIAALSSQMDGTISKRSSSWSWSHPWLS